MKLTNNTCEEFIDALASKKAVPGGGGVAALTGALGVALNTMVANFSIGKKKFKDIEKEHQEVIKEGLELKDELVNLINKDAENFLPLSKAYGMKADKDEEKKKKEKVLQNALKDACIGPVEMIENIYRSILLHERLLEKSSKIIISDIGVGVQCLKSSLYSAKLNVVINLNSIKDKEFKKQVEKRIGTKIEDGSRKADEIFKRVEEIMGN